MAKGFRSEFRSELKERIRDANDIVDVIHDYVPLKRSGTSFTALCPFHHEKTPSFHVHPSKQIFHCFGCNKGGDVFSFIQEYEQLSFVEAMNRLADRAHIPIEKGNDPKTTETKTRLYELHEALAARWHRILLNENRGSIAREYIKKRGLNQEIITRFRIGFAPKEWSDTLDWTNSKGYEIRLLEKAGILSRKEGGEHFYDRFRNRLMFPINDPQRRVIAFCGRVLDDSEKGAKYINSPETAIFKKGRILYALDKARAAALETKSMIVCEGQLDTIACHARGICNVVAPQGTALTSEQSRILKRHVESVILCFDSDQAGQNAMKRAFDELLTAGLSVRVASIPAPHDPDSFLRECGADAFRELLRGQDYFDYLLQTICAQNDLKSDGGRAAVVRAMSDALHKTSDAILIDTYAQRVGQKLGVAIEAVRSEFSKASKASKISKASNLHSRRASIVEERQIAKPSALEFWLLKLIVGQCDEGLMDWLFGHLEFSWVQHDVVRRALGFRRDQIADGARFEIAQLLGEFKNPSEASLLTEAAAEDRPIPNPKQQLEDIVKKLRNDHIDASLQRLTSQPGNANQVWKLQQLKRCPIEPLGDA